MVQLESLRQLRCPLAQGYYFSRPVLPDKAEDLIHQPMVRQRRSAG